MTKNIKRLRALINRVPVLIRDGSSLRKLWVDERDQSEWSRHVADVGDDALAAWVVDGPAFARAVSDDCERAKAECADARQKVDSLERFDQINRERLAALTDGIRVALKEAGIEQMADEDGDIVESLPDAVRRALKAAQ